jgi:thiamine-phosphate pyrophosphorylase
MSTLATPLVCVVSDGARLASAYGWPDQEAAVLAHAQQAAAGGADLFLVREPALPGRALERVVAAIRRSVGRSSMRVLVSDRLDVALAAGANGVHLKASSFDAGRARAIAPAGFLVGRSVHAEDEAVAAADAVDYLLFGTVLPSASKPPGHRTAGLELYMRVVDRLRPLPVLAIGGIDDGTIGRFAGAPGIAAIQWFLPDPAGADRLVEHIAHARRALAGGRSDDSGDDV